MARAAGWKPAPRRRFALSKNAEAAITSVASIREPGTGVRVDFRSLTRIKDEATAGMDAARSTFNRTSASARDARIALAQDILHQEAAAIWRLADRLDDSFSRAVDLLFVCPGNVLLSGIGKAGLIAQKLSATFASTGTRSHFLHAAEAVHGDLGRVRSDDVVVVLSQSGETEEIVRLLPSLAQLGAPLVAITGNPRSKLAQAAAVTLDLGPLEEACPLGLAPSTSTTVMLALGDALALVLSRMRDFKPPDFARFHPGGTLGRKLARVEDVMRPLEECRVARHDETVRAVLVQHSRPGRRSGAVMLVDEQGRLRGLFTDSDLARLFESNRDAAVDGPIAAVMTNTPTVVEQGCRVAEALATLAGRKFSELPVVDSRGRPVGLIDITDLLELLPRADLVPPEKSTPSAQSEDFPAALIVPHPNLRTGWLRKESSDDER